MQNNDTSQSEVSAAHPVRKVAKAAAFLVLVTALVAFLTALLTPSFHNDARAGVSGVYEQPANSVEVVAFGASTLRHGFSPDYLYEEYGIRGWNSCTSSQPMLSSYYLLQDVLRSQGDSVSLVMLDVTTLLRDDDYSARSTHAEKVGVNMQFSDVKIGYLSAMSQEYEDIDFFEQLFPVLRYHSRWSELEEDDFEKLVSKDSGLYLHGQVLAQASNASKGQSGKYTDAKMRKITPTVDYAAEDMEAMLNNDSLKYLDKLMALCAERGIDVLFVKTPASAWDDEKHDCITNLADGYGVPFLDLSASEYWDESGLSFDEDFYDGKHSNTAGSLKITACLGKYLAENYSFDTSGDIGELAFKDDDLRRFDEKVEDSRLLTCRDLEEYLALLDKERYTVFVAVKGESAEGLSDSARRQLADLGFEKLARLKKNGSYAGVMNGGVLVSEKASSKGAKVTVAGQFRDGSVLLEKTQMQPSAKLNNPIELISVGADSGSTASIKIDGSATSENKRGLNFVVCNKETGSVIDSSSFDTHVGSDRTSDLPSKGA